MESEKAAEVVRRVIGTADEELDVVAGATVVLLRKAVVSSPPDDVDVGRTVDGCSDVGTGSVVGAAEFDTIEVVRTSVL